MNTADLHPKAIIKVRHRNRFQKSAARAETSPRSGCLRPGNVFSCGVLVRPSEKGWFNRLGYLYSGSLGHNTERCSTGGSVAKNLFNRRTITDRFVQTRRTGFTQRLPPQLYHRGLARRRADRDCSPGIFKLSRHRNR